MPVVLYLARYILPSRPSLQVSAVGFANDLRSLAFLFSDLGKQVTDQGVTTRPLVQLSGFRVWPPGTLAALERALT